MSEPAQHPPSSDLREPGVSAGTGGTHRAGILALLTILSLLCWAGIRSLGDVRLHLGAFYGYFFIAFLLYLAALRLIGRLAGVPGAARGRWVALALILVGAIGSRALLAPTIPTLSDDLYRYVWDGRVQHAGIDPYLYPPNAPELAALRDGSWRRINFPHLRTIYPPLAQQAFRLGAAVAPSLWAQKLVFLSAECLTVASLWWLLAVRGLSPLWIAAYAWHPLVILEIAGSGHNDVLGMSLLWLGIAAWYVRPGPASALSWAAAFVSKISSIIMAPWWYARRSARAWLAVFLGMAAIPLLLWPTAIAALCESLSAMTTRFEANASGYLLLAGLLHHAGLARIVAVAAWIGCLVWWARREADPVRYVLGAWGAAMLLSPVAHPWYLTWLVPAFCIVRPAALVAWTATVVLSYASWPGYLAGTSWEVPAWARGLEYAPVALLGAWQLRRWWWRSSFLVATKPARLAKS